MKTELKAKFLQHLLSKKKENEGFTLIELLVVIIIIGILAAIALPSFLNQANKARQSEAQTYIGSINRGQQAYFLEKQCFGNLSNLELGISDTDNYTYTSPGDDGACGNTGEVVSEADPKPTLKGYAGRVYTATADDGTATTKALVCEGKVGEIPGVTGLEKCPAV
jgi:prepilin-type N-terminal cleavage/methylation domain-containing protein